MDFSLKKAMKTTIYGLIWEFERKKTHKNVRFLRFGARSATNSYGAANVEKGSL
jgi:hypothetical protein